MTPKLKTKLLKLVCKNSKLMREPFRNSSWTNKMTQSDKKPLIVNKSGEKFRSKIMKLSLGKTWSSIEKEWIIVKQVQFCKQREQCLCGRGNLKFVTYLRNIKTKLEIVSGNCCLLTFKW